MLTIEQWVALGLSERFSYHRGNNLAISQLGSMWHVHPANPSDVSPILGVFASREEAEAVVMAVELLRC